MWKINFVGAQSTGKTTVLNLFQKDPFFSGFVFKTEVVRKLVKEKGLKINEEGTVETQRILFEEYKKVLEEKSDYVSDRSILDVFAYSTWLSTKDNSEEWTSLIEEQSNYIKEHIEDLGVVVYFPIEFQVVPDGVRSVNESFRKDIDRIISVMLEMYHIPHITITGSVNERSFQIKEKVLFKKPLAVISVSGGLDSTCLLLDLLSQGYAVKCYSFDYGQKQIIEQRKLKNNIDFLISKGFLLTLQIIDLKDCFSDSQSSLRRRDEKVPTGDYGDTNMKSTVVENRNVIFSSIIYGKALSLSRMYDTDVEIYLGIHSGDHTLYPDCRPESREACEKAFKISNWGSERVSYEAPFIDSSKGEVLKAGLLAMDGLNLSSEEQSFILKNTHTCYDPDNIGRSCGKCGSCRERLEAFAENGIKDPITYIPGN